MSTFSRHTLAVTVLTMLAAIVAMEVASAAEPQASTDAPTARAVTAGKVLFNTVGCWSCHGFNGQGATSRGIASGPRINARVLPEAAFIHQLRSPVSVMPPYTSVVLTDEEVHEIYEYLRTLPEPPAVGDVPLLTPPV